MPFSDAKLLLSCTFSLAGHFTRKDRLQVIAVPLVVASNDLTTPVPVTIYTAPEKPLDAPVDDDSNGWETDVPFPDTFALVHEITGTFSPTIYLEIIPRC